MISVEAHGAHRRVAHAAIMLTTTWSIPLPYPPGFQYIGHPSECQLHYHRQLGTPQLAQVDSDLRAGVEKPKMKAHYLQTLQFSSQIGQTAILRIP